MYLFFDTETTGLPKSWKAPVTDVENWPRLVQIAWLVFDADGQQIASESHIIRPEGFTIPIDAARIHGITTERAGEDGVSIVGVLQKFQDAVRQAEVLVAHNMQFDEKIVGAELLRMNAVNSLEGKEKICTMLASVTLCNIEGPYGLKWPKLSELHEELFGVGFDEAHNASVDISATAKCFWEMKKLRII